MHQMQVKEAREAKLGNDKVPKQRSTCVSMSWLMGFLKRHPSIKLAPSRVMEKDRSENSTKQEIDLYILNLKSLFDLHNYDPSMVANFDETFLVWGCNRFKVLTRSSNKAGIVKEMEIHEHVTLCATIFGDGTALHPLIILPLVYLPQEIKTEDWPYFDWTGQTSGWISKDIFQQYCEDVLIPEFERRRKTLPADKQRGLLIVDGHGTRTNAGLMQKFRDANIDVIVLPAHTSHITQPLDLVVFGVFKRRLNVFSEHKHAKTAAEKRIALLYATQFAWQQASAHWYITKSFRKGGVIPLDSSKLTTSDCVLKAPTPLPLVEDATTKKNGPKIRISNSILTDRIEELAQYEAEAAAKKAQKANPKKRLVTDGESEEPTAKKPKKAAARPPAAMETDDADSLETDAINRQCSLCPAHTTIARKSWTQCLYCPAVWSCPKHPMRLEQHYKDEHGEDDNGHRKRRVTRPKSMDDYIMDSDEE